MKYVKPPLVREIKQKNSFVHNAIANKFKRNDDHLISAYKLANPRKIAIIKELHANSVEFGTMSAFKNALFGSEHISEDYMLPLEEFERIREYETVHQLDSVRDKLVAEIVEKGGSTVNLKKLMDIIDLFTMLPFHKPMANNASSTIYNILSSGTQSGPTNKRPGSGGALKKALDL